MNKVTTVQLEWKYSPNTYLEESVSISFEGCSLEIEDGIALAKIDPIVFQDNESIRDYLTQLIESRLYAVLILTHRDFELSKVSRTDIREDGNKIHFLEVDSIVHIHNIGSIELVVKDEGGNIVSGTKRDRFEKQQWFSFLINQFRSSDKMLEQMLKSYQMSVKDPDNELVHLYEIRDSLFERFGSKKQAIKQLDITSKKWDEIGELANNRPLKQGRHRGKSAGFLRDAGLQELEKGR